MYSWICCAVLLISLIFLFLKYRKKVELDREEAHKLDTDIELLKQEKNILSNEIRELHLRTDEAIERYQNAQRDKVEELEEYFQGQKRRRQEIMDADMAQRQADLDRIIESKQKDVDNEIIRLNQILQNTQAETEQEAAQYWLKVYQERKKYESLLEPIKQYEKDRQERLFYTIQLPEEYQEDIEFLLTSVAAKVQHPDIISKLVWAEYVKPNLDNTFKRIEIKAEPGIYKLTSLENGMAYIGKSTDVKKRIADHFKSSIGIRSIADQAVHHAILKEGFWNWTIEIITYADKDKLNELEKYYIEFFKTQEFGYNKNSGGGG